MQKARRHPEGLRPLVGKRFQVLFHPVIHGTFHLSLTVLVHYRSIRSIQPCGMVPADSDRISLVPPYSGYCTLYTFYAYGIITLFDQTSQTVPLVYKMSVCSPTTPYKHAHMVWASPRSLATTQGITFVFFSYRYLDVSVPYVRPH